MFESWFENVVGYIDMDGESSCDDAEVHDQERQQHFDQLAAVNAIVVTF